MSTLTFRGFQALLIDNGFSCGSYGADGIYGSATAKAFENWGRSGKNLVYDDTGQPPTGTEPPGSMPIQIVPADWMPDCKMTRIILHWTAGSHKASDNDKDHYHILVEADGKLVRGKKTIKDNVSTSDGVYAAHTKDCNTGSIGVALCGMAGAIENPFYAGTAPINEAQWSVGAQVFADLCNEYTIPISKTTTLSHGRVQANLGIAQSGKWDICRLPWNLTPQGEACDELFREEIRRFI